MLREALTLERLGELPADEAAALFVARRAEGLTDSEQELLQEWLAQDERHQDEFERADAAWNSFSEADDDEILAAMREHALRPRHQLWAGWRSVAAAAILLLVIGTGFLVIPLVNRQPGVAGTGHQQIAGAIVQYASMRGQISDVVLADGTKVTLDADSLVVARLQTSVRSIQLLRGRALFDVRHDSARPFIVTAGRRRIIDIGTRFDVNLAAGTLTVTLLSGRITVGPLDPKEPPVVLAPGNQFIDRRGAITVRAGIDPDQQTSWQRGLLDFDDETLEEAAVEVNRYSTDRILINDANVATMRVSGQFRIGEADRFARTVAEIHPLRVIRHSHEIELAPAK